MEPVKASKKTVKQPEWKQPSGGENKGLYVYNSLTSTKVPFIPAKGNRVTWYICGPTVYDSAHFGHARNYLTFDIIRRILEDYFNYEVFAVMNITDVDDKIILKARKGHLVQIYESKHAALSQKVVAYVTSAFEDYKMKLLGKERQLSEEKSKLEAAAFTLQDVGAQKGLTQKLMEKGAELRLTQDKLWEITHVERKLEELKNLSEEELAKVSTAEGLLDLKDPYGAPLPVRDVLAELLDKERGKNVREEHIFRAHAAKYEKEFIEDMTSLGIRMPDALTRVTEYVPYIVSYVEKIIANGFAYESNGSVYFDTVAFSKGGHDYGKLEPWSVGDEKLLQDGEGALSQGAEKRSSNDFALWKKSKPGEPTWDSPWGKGRPGWHIECSAMASDILGNNMDIHSGGSDLRFPHHDNELAQSEAHFGCAQWVNYFLHSGHLHIDGLKMSKSLKNFITIREVLKQTTPRQIRLYFAMQSWHNVMDFDRKNGLEELRNKEKVLLRFFESVSKIVLDAKSAEEEETRWTTEEKELHDKLLSTQEAVHAAFLNNFDTPKALRKLFDIVRETNIYINRKTGTSASTSNNTPIRGLLVRKIAAYVAKILNVIGIQFPEYGFGAASSSASSSGGSSEVDKQTETRLIKPYLDILATLRQQIRDLAIKGAPASEFLKLTDHLRDEIMPNYGIRLEDEGSHLWTAVPAELLKQELQRKKENTAKQLLEKTKRRIVALTRDIENWQSYSVPPEDYGKDKYSEFDAEGLPVKEIGGKEVSKKLQKLFPKSKKKHEENHKKYLKMVEKDPLFLDNLKAELQRLKESLAE
ncbi:cysteinyl-tRNA synthetase [Balamuthia mandrillaris]